MTRGAPVLLPLIPLLGLSLAAGSTPAAAPDHAAAVSSVADDDARPLPYFYDLYTFRGPDGLTDVVASFAVPAGELEQEKLRGGIRYRFDVTLILADTARGTLSRTDDSVYVVMPRSLGDEHLLYTQIEVEAEPSGSTLHRVIMTDAATPGVGQLFGDRFRIPDYGGDALMLSDIALGRRGAEAGWQRGNVKLALLPTSQFPASEFDVYYEVYNLPNGRPYTTEIEIEAANDADQRDQPSTVLRFTDEAEADRGATVRELRSIQGELPRGTWRITVTVHDLESGQSASRSRIFDVRGVDRRVTPVPARPHDAYPGTGSGYRLPRGD